MKYRHISSPSKSMSQNGRNCFLGWIWTSMVSYCPNILSNWIDKKVGEPDLKRLVIWADQKSVSGIFCFHKVSILLSIYEGENVGLNPTQNTNSGGVTQHTPICTALFHQSIFWSDPPWGLRKLPLLEVGRRTALKNFGQEVLKIWGRGKKLNFSPEYWQVLYTLLTALSVQLYSQSCCFRGIRPRRY